MSKAKLVALSLVLITLTAAFVANAEPMIGTITRVQKAAFVNDNPAIRTGTVRPNDTITTDADGRVEITFKDGSVLTVGGGSEMRIDHFSYDPAPTLGKALLTLTRGAFRMVTSAIVDANPEEFAIRTPLATIGIRGTDFWGGFLSAEVLDVIMLKGTGVAVTTRGGTVVIEEPGFGVTVPETGIPPQNLTKWDTQKLGRAVQTVTFK